VYKCASETTCQKCTANRIRRKAGLRLRASCGPFPIKLKKRPQIEFNLSSALLEAVYREGKKDRKNESKKAR
jgi:hypothetical protein